MAAIHQAAQKAQVMQCYPFPGGITDFPVGDKTFFDEIPRRNKWNLKISGKKCDACAWDYRTEETE